MRMRLANSYRPTWLGNMGENTHGTATTQKLCDSIEIGKVCVVGWGVRARFFSPPKTQQYNQHRHKQKQTKPPRRAATKTNQKEANETAATTETNANQKRQTKQLPRPKPTTARNRDRRNHRHDRKRRRRNPIKQKIRNRRIARAAKKTPIAARSPRLRRSQVP